MSQRLAVQEQDIISGSHGAPPRSPATVISLSSGMEQRARSVRPAISVVVPSMNEEGNIDDLYVALVENLQPLGRTYEVVFIDDGSSDRTWQVMKSLAERDPVVIALRHRRNFGKAQGLATGFAVASGEVVITMDGDLQDDPAEIPRFLEMLDDGYDLVSGWKQRRQDPLGKTLPSKLFNATVS
ncbi:MAG: glycosyltransferase family 2 protein, partial [Thermomicrobiales bacterium]